MNGSPRRDTTKDVTSVARGTVTRPRRGQGVHPLVALLIAGEREQADRYASKLRADGYTVISAAGLERGLELAVTAQPDLIFVCVGSWSVPTLVLLMLRSDHSTRDVPTVLVTDEPRAQLAAEVGGLRSTEHVVPRRSAVHVTGEVAWPERRAGCGHRTGVDRWLRG